MKNLPLLIAAVGLVATAAMTAQTKTASLQGAWQTVDINITGPNARNFPVAKNAPYLTIFTAKHYSRTEVQSDGPRPIIADAAKASADELRSVWGPVVCEAGTYEVSGNTITMHPMVSKSPAAMASGAFIVSSFKIEGDTLTIAQQRNQAGAYPNPVTFKLTRVE
jgi:hypothetical protein